MADKLVERIVNIRLFKFRSLFYRLDVPEVVIRIRQIPDTQLARCDSRIRQAADNAGRFDARAERVSAPAPNQSDFSLLILLIVFLIQIPKIPYSSFVFGI